MLALAATQVQISGSIELSLAAPVLKLLPILAATRAGQSVAYLAVEEGSGGLEWCWSIAAGERQIEERGLFLEPAKLHPELSGDISDERPLREVTGPARLAVQEMIPAFGDPRARVYARAVVDREGMRGVLLFARPRRWFASRDTVLDPLCALLESEIARETERSAQMTILRADHTAVVGELDRVTARTEALGRELEKARQTLAGVEPRIEALEYATGRGTDMLMEAHTRLARAEERLCRHGRIFTTLREMLERHAAGASPRELAAELVRMVSEAFGGSRCSLLLADSDTAGREYLRLAAARGLPANIDPREVRIRPGQGISGWVASSGEEVVVRDEEEAARLPLSAGEGYTGSAFASFPLTCHGRFSGVLNLTNFRAGTFGNDELDELRVVSLSVALVVDHARLNERLFALDPL